MANDLLVGNKHIPKMYFGTKGVLQVYFGNKLIWPNNQKRLLAGSQNVCIEFIVPNGPNDNDIQLSNLAIFTHDNIESNTIDFRIYHESGLVVYQYSGDTIDHTVSPKYGLDGDLRKVQSIQNVTLKKGLKYYIQYTNQNGTLRPAYFENITGNYLNWVAVNQNKQTADINSVNSYLGLVTDVADWLNASENNLIINKIVSHGSFFENNAYIRNGQYNNASIIGTANQDLSVSDKDKLLKLNSNDSFLYVGNNYYESSQTVLDKYYLYTKNNTLDTTKYKGEKTTVKSIINLSQYEYCIYTGTTASDIKQNHVYQKTQNITIDSYMSLNSYSDNVSKLKALLKASYNSTANSTTNKSIAIESGSLDGTDYTGNVFTYKSGNKIDFGTNDNGYTCATVPSVDKTMYYLTDTGSLPDGGWAWTTGLWFYDSTTNDKWIFFANNSQVQTIKNYFNITSLSSVIQEIEIRNIITATNNSLYNLAKTSYDNQNYIVSDIRQQTVQPDKKFYLEINGEEK